VQKIDYILNAHHIRRNTDKQRHQNNSDGVHCLNVSFQKTCYGRKIRSFSVFIDVMIDRSGGEQNEGADILDGCAGWESWCVQDRLRCKY
jgi:hypothetical protein